MSIQGLCTFLIELFGFVLLSFGSRYILNINDFYMYDLQIFPLILYVAFSCCWLCHSEMFFKATQRKSSSWDIHG